MNRRIHNDGTVQIVCTICGKPLLVAVYAGFSSAICVDCQQSPVVDPSKKDLPMKDLPQHPKHAPKTKEKSWQIL